MKITHKVLALIILMLLYVFSVNAVAFSFPKMDLGDGDAGVENLDNATYTPPSNHDTGISNEDHFSTPMENTPQISGENQNQSFNEEHKTSCDDSHPSNCEAQSTCEEEGHIWCNNYCYAFDDKELPDKCGVNCQQNQIHFTSEFNGKKIEMCISKENKYMLRFENNTQVLNFDNLSEDTAKIKRYLFPLYLGDNLTDGIINNGDVLELKARVYPLEEPYDLYLAVTYQGDDNKTAVLFFEKANNTIKVYSEVKAFDKNIQTDMDFEEINSNIKVNLCDLLQGLPGNLTVWYIAFPASEEYSDSMSGLLERFREQAHSIEYYVLENKCEDE